LLPKNYVYFAMAFSVIVELLQLAYDREERRQHERQRFEEDADAEKPKGDSTD
jgi:hypothetical protein